MDFRYECGYVKSISNIDLGDKDIIVKCVWLHYIYCLPHVELMQLRKGFRETLQLEALISLHPEAVYTCLIASESFDVTGQYLIDAFSINYSFQGSNKRTTEEAIIMYWTDYIMDCSG